MTDDNPQSTEPAQFEQDKVSASSEATGEQPKSLQVVLMGCANLLDTIKGEWGNEWSDWDQSIRDGITRELRKIADAPDSPLGKPASPSPVSVSKFAEEWVQGLEQAGYLDFDGGGDLEREDIICRLANKLLTEAASPLGLKEEPSDHVGAETQKGVNPEPVTCWRRLGEDEVIQDGDICNLFGSPDENKSGILTRAAGNTPGNLRSYWRLERIQENTTSVSEPNENAGAPPVTQDSVSVPVSSKLVGAAPGEWEPWTVSDGLRPGNLCHISCGRLRHFYFTPDKKDNLEGIRECHEASLASLRGELGEAKVWKASVLLTVKAIPEYESGEWGGDKEGWGFCFALIGWQTREVASLRSRLGELKAWKESALKQLNEIDLQAVSKAMNLPLGRDIGPEILPYIVKVNEALSWYREQAEAIQRYTADANTDGQLACMKALELDGGRRATEATKVNEN